MASVGGTAEASRAGPHAAARDTPSPAHAARPKFQGLQAISPGVLLTYSASTVCPMAPTATSARARPSGSPSAVPATPSTHPSATNARRTIPCDAPRARTTPICGLRRTTETETVL